jgi:2'-5' RNA ligase
VGRSPRLFVGVFLPYPAALEVHRAVRGRLEAGDVRLVPPEEFHLTLHFLGATDEVRIPVLSDALTRRVSALPAPRLRLSSTGAFPDAAAARILWVGVREEPGAEGRLSALAGAARAAAVDAGASAAGEEPWSAHLTVARSARRGRMQLPDGFRELRLDVPWRPEEVRLVESCPGETGAARFPLLAAFRLLPECA